MEAEEASEWMLWKLKSHRDFVGCRSCQLIDANKMIYFIATVLRLKTSNKDSYRCGQGRQIRSGEEKRPHIEHQPRFRKRCGARIYDLTNEIIE